MKYFQINIFILYERNGIDVYKIDKEAYDLTKKSIILIWIGDNHFESVGERIGLDTKTVWNSNESLIKKLYERL
jgi:hypothetical protein